METKKQGNFNEILRERTLTMSLQVQELFRGKKVPLLDRPAVNQIIRSSTSVAANCRAATRARSDAEFYAKICIVAEECDETQFWFTMLVRKGLISLPEKARLQDEVDQLVRIYTSIKKKMKDRIDGLEMGR